MNNDCDHNCSTCSESCDERDMRESPHPLSKIKKVIGVVSGKGGVGKSSVTSMLAVLSQRNGLITAVLDADITGASIPKAFGITGQAESSELGIFPVKSKTGVKIMSTNLLLENDTDPVIWRGPLIASMVKQFWTDVIWDETDIMFIDMPPGTGDVPLTVFQSIPIDGIIVVTSPQELVSMIVAKAVKMAEKMNISVLGLIENMSYVKCPCCETEIKIFGESKLDQTAKAFNLEILGRIPVDPKLSASCDSGTIENYDCGFLNKAAQKIFGI